MLSENEMPMQNSINAKDTDTEVIENSVNSVIPL